MGEATKEVRVLASQCEDRTGGGGVHFFDVPRVPLVLMAVLAIFYHEVLAHPRLVRAPRHPFDR